MSKMFDFFKQNCRIQILCFENEHQKQLIFQVPIVIGTCVAKFVSKTVPGHNWPITEFLYNKELFNL